MKFKKGKLYKVVKGDWCASYCAGCVLKYGGIAKHSAGRHYGDSVKLGKYCHIINYHCWIFQGAIDSPNRYKLVEYIDMVKFCKKLKKELDENRNIKKS